MSYLPHFVARMERSVRVRSLRDFAGDLEEGSLLCPVHALRACLDQSKSVVALSSTLFISPLSPSRAISKNAVSYFLREVISGTGAVRGDEGPNL